MRYLGMGIILVFLAGCASTPSYNPLQVQVHQQLLLNDSGFKALQKGMSLDQVHQVMGEKIIIGYAWQAPDYKPLTIPNPYKVEKFGQGYTVEYYVSSIQQPDGIVNDDELTPVVFQDSHLAGQGWPFLHSLHLTKPSA